MAIVLLYPMLICKKRFLNLIKLPEFSVQNMYEAETNFNLMMTHERLAKFLVHWEVMKLTNAIPGSIVECGVFKGTSFSRFALMRQLLGGDFSSKLIGFDCFSDSYPNTSYDEDKDQRDHWIDTAGPASISVGQLERLLTEKRISNFELVAGDACKTVPEYCQENKGLKISLLNIDIDFVEPTLSALTNFFPRVVSGGIVLLDNYAGEGTSGLSYHGDTLAIDNYFADQQIEIKRFPFAARPAYIVKQ